MAGGAQGAYRLRYQDSNTSAQSKNYDCGSSLNNRPTASPFGGMREPLVQTFLEKGLSEVKGRFLLLLFPRAKRL